MRIEGKREKIKDIPDNRVFEKYIEGVAAFYLEPFPDNGLCSGKPLSLFR